jgi:hypothetical protein
MNLGEGKPGEVLTGGFTLRNLGGQSMDFRLSAGCGCTELNPLAGSIAPGDNQHVKIVVRLPSEYGSERSFQLTIRTNDPDHPEVQVPVRAYCPALFKTIPANLDFGPVSADSPHELLFKVMDGTRRRSKLTDLILAEVDRSELSLEAILDEENLMQYRLRLSAGAPPGYFQGGLRLTNKLTGESIWRPVSAQIRSDLVVAPRIIRPPASLDSPWKASFLVYRTDGQKLGSVTHSEMPSGVTIESNVSQRSSSRKQFHLIIPPGAGKLSGSTVKLWFTGIKQPVVMKLNSDES